MVLDAHAVRPGCHSEAAAGWELAFLLDDEAEIWEEGARYSPAVLQRWVWLVKAVQSQGQADGDGEQVLLPPTLPPSTLHDTLIPHRHRLLRYRNQGFDPSLFAQQLRPTDPLATRSWGR